MPKPDLAPASNKAPSGAQGRTLSLGARQRRFAFATAVLTGASVMIVQILGVRMLSPHLGASHFVWTAQISVTLAALALGYYAGGRLADRTLDLKWLYLGILAAAGYLALTVPLTRVVADGCLRLNLAAGSLAASMFLFFIPLSLLAMTGPYLVRVMTASVSQVGGNLGRLTAVGTLGSFVGTLLIGYLLIAFVPNSVTMYSTALLLALVAGAYFTMIRRPARD